MSTSVLSSYCFSTDYYTSNITNICALTRSTAGTTIPIGIPVLFVIGGWMFMEGQREEEADDQEGLRKAGVNGGNSQ